MALRYQRVTELPALRELATPWRNLLQDSGINGAPLSFEWHLAWWECFGTDGNLAIGCVYDNNKLIAIAPMMAKVERLKGVSLKTYQLMNNGYSPFGGLIYSKSLEGRRLRDVIEVLLDNSDGDVLRLQKIPASSQLFANVIRRAFSGLRVTTQPSLRTPIIPVDGDWENYLQSRSKSFRKSIRRKLKKFAANDNARIQEYVVQDRGDPVLEEIFDVSARSWKAQAGTDLRNDADGREFFRRLVDMFGHNSKILVWVLYLDERAVAFEFLLVDQGVAFPVRADFDESSPEYSPGTVLMCHVLQTLCNRNSVHSYDCCSNDYSYLMSWTERQRDHSDIEFFKGSIKPLLMFAAKHHVAPRVRRLKQTGQRWYHSLTTDLKGPLAGPIEPASQGTQSSPHQ